MTEKNGFEFQVTIWKNGTEKQIIVRGEREREREKNMFLTDNMFYVLRFTISVLQ